jgi:beta-1,4-N-acetylglucosaminyltransferase
MAVGIPMIIVPNPALQDNHQVELAEEMQRLRYAIHVSSR